MDKSTEANILENLDALVAYQTVSFSREKFHQDQISKSLLYIKDKLLKIGLFHIQEIEHNGSLSLIVGTEDTLEPDIVLSAHIDVIPASRDMFKMRIEKGKALGRGVGDMKFAIATYLEVLRSIRIKDDTPSLSMVVTSDEEIGSANGAKYIAEELGYRPQLIFVPDGGKNWQLVQKAKGAMQIKVQVSGKAAHASRPWLGDSANDKIVDFIASARRQYPEVKRELWDAVTMNIGILKGGLAVNQVSDQAEAVFDFRFPQKKLRNEIETVMKKFLPAGGVTSFVAEAYCFAVNLNNTDIQRFVGIVEKITGKKVRLSYEFGATDARFFNRVGSNAIVLMPPADGLHSKNEWISVRGIVDYYKSLIEFINSTNKGNFE